jgi:hypothetical protein
VGTDAFTSCTDRSLHAQMPQSLDSRQDSAFEQLVLVGVVFQGQRNCSHQYLELSLVGTSCCLLHFFETGVDFNFTDQLDPYEPPLQSR